MEPLGTVIFRPSNTIFGFLLLPYILCALRTHTACRRRVANVEGCVVKARRRAAKSTASVVEELLSLLLSLMAVAGVAAVAGMLWAEDKPSDSLFIFGSKYRVWLVCAALVVSASAAAAAASADIVDDDESWLTLCCVAVANNNSNCCACYCCYFVDDTQHVIQSSSVRRILILFFYSVCFKHSLVLASSFTCNMNYCLLALLIQHMKHS